MRLYWGLSHIPVWSRSWSIWCPDDLHYRALVKRKPTLAETNLGPWPGGGSKIQDQSNMYCDNSESKSHGTFSPTSFGKWIFEKMFKAKYICLNFQNHTRVPNVICENALRVYMTSRGIGVFLPSLVTSTTNRPSSVPRAIRSRSAGRQRSSQHSLLSLTATLHTHTHTTTTPLANTHTHSE